jgi:2-keto-3-deoxy-6-phosphogluconate aldolase
MNQSQKAFEVLKSNRLLAFLAPESVDDCVQAYETLGPSGVILEVAFRTDKALDGIRETVRRHPDALVFAGTVMTRKQAERAMDAGAAGVISADYIPAVVAACAERDVTAVPGGLSDAGKQLAQKAELYGCELEELREKHPHQWIYKLFPAVTEHARFYSLSKQYQSAYKGLRMVYTGGISLDNLKELAAYDPDGIFCGSAVCRRIREPGEMLTEARRWMEIILKRE